MSNQCARAIRPSTQAIAQWPGLKCLHNTKLSFPGEKGGVTHQTWLHRLVITEAEHFRGEMGGCISKMELEEPVT